MGVGDWDGNLATSWCLHCVGGCGVHWSCWGRMDVAEGPQAWGLGFGHLGWGRVHTSQWPGGSGRTQLGHPGQGHREGGTWKTTHRTTTKLTRGRLCGHPKARL